jgi:hypothetical protein
VARRIAILAALVVLLARAVPVGAQTPSLEGTVLCPSVAHWFADGYTRLPRKSGAAIQAYLVLYNGMAESQAVTVTVYAPAPTVLTRTLAPKTRQVLDLYAELGAKDLNFSVDVQFARYGAADLKMWSGTAVIATSLPLTVCRPLP